MYLAGDVGGTKTILALFDDSLKIVKKEVLLSKDFSSFEELLDNFLTKNRAEYSKACFGVPGPVIEGVCKVTNLPWVIDSRKIKNSVLINDFEAIGYGIELLKTEDVIELKKIKSVENAPIGIIGPGTGLGEAFIVFCGSQKVVLSSEGGNCDFAPKNELEIDFLKYMTQFGNVSYEMILSGKGLKFLYDFLLTKNYPECEGVKNAADSAVGITSNKDHKTCAKVLQMFVSILGAEAGNVALKLNTLGGVYVAGGITLKIIDCIVKDFLNSFHNKGKLKHLVEKIPVFVIKNPEVGLLGAMKYCLTTSKL